MTADRTGEEMLSIGEASQRIDLPESTIRYYDKEFSDYLSIPRGKNNQRLFDEENLQDLEYVRYLIKREELSIEEVRNRLHREKDYRDSSPSEDSDDPAARSARDDQDRQEASPDSPSAETLQEIVQRLDDIDARLDNLENRQDRIEELLDLNLQRYNKLVEDL